MDTNDYTLSDFGWKDVPGYDGRYQVNTIGEVKSIRTTAKGKTEQILRQCIIGGYSHVWLYKDGARIMWKVHRLMLLTFTGKPQDKKEVNHKNGIRTDNRTENLEYCTRTENVHHARDVLGKKFSKEGELSNGAKLTDEQVRKIREIYSSQKPTFQRIADMFHVSRRTVTLIIKRKTWRHI